MSYTAEQIAGCTGAPLDKVQRNWPIVKMAMGQDGLDDHWNRVGVIATIARETGTFEPLEEEGGWPYYVRELGAAEAPYHGRGYIQLTWSYNYRHYGAELGLDLLANPSLALDAGVAARVLCLYWKERNIPAMCEARNWAGVQTAVNGGWVNWDRFYGVVLRLLATPEPADHPPVTKVAVEGWLYTQPRTDSPHAIAQDGSDRRMKIGEVVTFTGRVTPHWAEVDVPGTPVHGWFQRAFLTTIYGGADDDNAGTPLRVEAPAAGPS